MSKIPKSLFDYAKESSKKHNIDVDVVKDILSNLPNIKLGYELAFIVEKKLGLRAKYFSDAFSKGYSIKADMFKEHDHLYVKLDDDIKRLLEQNYICCKITKEEANEFEVVVSLTKNTLLGFYK